MAAPTRRKVSDIVGESRETRSGEPRQQIILHCGPGDEISLVRQPENPHDPNAVLIMCGDSDVGFLSREDAALLAPALDAEIDYRAQIHRIKGGVPNASSYGLQIAVAWEGQTLPDAVELDSVQLKSRQGKLAAKGRNRSAKGRFEAGEATDCLFLVVIILLPVGICLV